MSSEGTSGNMEPRLRALLDAAGIGTWVHDLESGAVVGSPRQLALFGIDPASYRGSWAELEERIHDGDRGLVARALKDTSHELACTFRVVWPDASEHWLESRGSWQHDDRGNATQMLGVVMDASERARLSARAATAERELGRVLERVSDACVALDRDWRYTYVNSQAAELFGRTPEALLGKHIWTEFPEGVGQPFHLAYERAMAEQRSIQLEDCYEPWDRWFENRIFPSPDGVTIFFHEITDRKRAERAERDASELARQVIASAPEGIVAVDDELRCVAMNTAMERMLGMEPGQGIGKRPRDILPEALLGPAEERLRRVLAGETVETTEQALVTNRPGPARFINTVRSPLRDAGGRVSGALTFVRDITAQKLAELLVVCQNRTLASIASGAPLEQSLGVLARGVEELAPGMRCSILLLDDDGVHLRHGAAPSLPIEYTRAIDGQPIGPDAGSCGTSAYTAEPVYTEDIETDPRWARYSDVARPHGLRACWSTPIVDRTERVRGTFAMYYAEPCLPEPWHLKIVSMATATAAVAISSHRERLAQAAAENELRALSASLLVLQDQERRRIARELHDTTVQNLAALATNLSLLSGDRKLVDECIALADKSSQELRTLSYLLHPPLLEDFGLSRALAEYADGFARRSEVRTSVEVAPELGRLPRDVELALFRVVQESLSNVHRHSGSKTASVRLRPESGAVVLEVADAGAAGWDPGARPGVGLAGMRERLRLLGGTLALAHGPSGTRVTARVPLTKGGQ